MANEKTEILHMAPRSHDNIGSDVTLLYAHWSILYSNVEEVDMQPEKHGIHTLVSSPDPTLCEGKGLVTLERFLGCADTAVM